MRRLLRLGLLIVVAGLLLSVLWVAIYRVVNPPTTFLMLRDQLRGQSVSRHWQPLDSLPRQLPQAVIAAEDSRFCAHHGFDLKAMRKALAANADGDRLRGGSTISQQTAKNVFLWPGRNFLRKGIEAWFTVLIERLWGKRRIMEVYLNVAEFGIGVFGADAAARHYFHKPASALTALEAARLAAILPQPIKRSASRPGPYTRRYAGRIRKRLHIVERDQLAACLQR